ncbi:hypothetical protein MHYP_G00232690 [Metynnis hypsauchen]
MTSKPAHKLTKDTSERLTSNFELKKAKPAHKLTKDASMNSELKKADHMDWYMEWFRYFLFSIWACDITMIFLLMHLQQKIILIKQRCERAQRTQRAATSTKREDSDMLYETISEK